MIEELVSDKPTGITGLSNGESPKKGFSLRLNAVIYPLYKTGCFNHNNTQPVFYSKRTEEQMNVKNKWLGALLLTLALILGMTQVAVPVQALMVEKKDTTCISPKMVQLKSDMQKVWIDHTIWTRNYIVSALSNLPDQKDVLDRLLRNQQDIGNVIKPYYGEEAGNKLADIMREHILIAGKIVAAAKSGNQAELKKLEKDWHRNADDIAKFLSAANPNWEFKELQDMLYTHLQLITEIVLDRLKGDWKADIAATDKNEIHMIHFADILTEGIVKQFPEKF